MLKRPLLLKPDKITRFYRRIKKESRPNQEHPIHDDISPATYIFSYPTGNAIEKRFTTFIHTGKHRTSGNATARSLPVSVNITARHPLAKERQILLPSANTPVNLPKHI